MLRYHMFRYHCKLSTKIESWKARFWLSFSLLEIMFLKLKLLNLTLIDNDFLSNNSVKSTSTGYFTVNCSAFEQSYSSNDSLKYKLQFQFDHNWFKMIQDKKDRPDFQSWWILKGDWPWVLLTCFFGGKIMLSDLYWSLWSNFDRPNFVIPAIFK